MSKQSIDENETAYKKQSECTSNELKPHLGTFIKKNLNLSHHYYVHPQKRFLYHQK